MFTIYTKPDCPFCVRAKSLLDRKQLEYKEVVIGKDIERDEFIAIYPDARTVPHIIGEDGVTVGGYTQLSAILEGDLT